MLPFPLHVTVNLQAISYVWLPPTVLIVSNKREGIKCPIHGDLFNSFYKLNITGHGSGLK